ncbi:MAG TPA: GNAT family N-acetyltransferase [Candidatus Babeliales bacterium]|nr:GNAT family N-acetyltransferase [Candidatus Babeliales bacterium]
MIGEKPQGPTKLEIDLGDNLRLEELTTADAAEIIELVKDDPEGMRSFGESAAKLFSSTESLVESMENETRHHYLGLRVEGALAVLLAYLTEPRQTVKLSYYTGKNFRKQGLAKRALSALTEEFFERKGIYHLIATVSESNLASIALLESTGFQKVSEFPDGSGEKFFRYDLEKPGHENDP